MDKYDEVISLWGRVKTESANFEKKFELHISGEYAIKTADLINRQKAEIERLQRYNKEYSFCNLLGNVLVYSKNLEDYNDMRKGLKSEAIKEFAERLKIIFNFGVRVYDGMCTVDGVVHNIDNLVKEMTESK